MAILQPLLNVHGFNLFCNVHRPNQQIPRIDENNDSSNDSDNTMDIDENNALSYDEDTMDSDHLLQLINRTTTTRRESFNQQQQEEQEEEDQDQRINTFSLNLKKSN